jgi:hypothetical protein
MRNNRRYNLRRRTPSFIPVNKGTLQRKAKPKTQRPVIRQSQKGFPQFPRLPQEIRLKIWDMVTDEPRAVIIRGRLGDSHGGLRSPTPPPAALHVCLESREVALKKYELVFSARYLFDYPARIWFNFSKDMVYFRNRGEDGWSNLSQFRSIVSTKDLERIQFLGIGIEPNTSPISHWPLRLGRGNEPWLKAWTGLQVYYRCHESGHSNVLRNLTFFPLRGNGARAFVRQYRWVYGKNGRFKGLSVSAAVEQIQSEVTASSVFRGATTAETCLVTIANS